MVNRKKVIIGVLAAVIVIAAAIMILSSLGLLPSFGGNDGEVAYVQTVSSLLNTSFSVDRYSGVVESQKAITYKKDPDRKIEEVYVKVGDVVKKGTSLFKYDVRTSENNIASIKLDIEGLNNEISFLQSQGNSTDIQLQISERQLEIRQKQADLKKYEQELSQAEVKSEISGVIKAVSETGQDPNGMEVPIITMTETGEFRIKGKVSEQTIGTIYSGMPVIVRSRVNEDETWLGSISKIETEPNTNDQDSGYYGYGSGERSSTYPFYISLESTVGLMLGQHVFIEPDYGQSEIVPKEGLWLDQSFIVMEEGADPYVWVAKNGRITKRVVGLGEFDDTDYSVQILSGLEESDLISWPDETLREGMKIKDIAEVE